MRKDNLKQTMQKYKGSQDTIKSNSASIKGTTLKKLTNS